MYTCSERLIKLFFFFIEHLLTKFCGSLEWKMGNPKRIRRFHVNVNEVS